LESNGPQPLVEATGLGKDLGGRRILEGVDLAVCAGQSLAVVGPNGAGKTTLLRMLSAMLVPDRGTASIAGHDLHHDPGGVRMSIGLHLGEDRSWYWRLSGRRNLEFFATVAGVPKRAIPARVAELLELVGLRADAERAAGKYSTGMRARLGLARALAGAAPVLLLDEPTRSLDVDAAADFRRVVVDLIAGGTMAVVYSTHSPREPEELGSEVLHLAHRSPVGSAP
jgi:ABC-2 type transport system ATP-binding protein